MLSKARTSSNKIQKLWHNKDIGYFLEDSNDGYGFIYLKNGEANTSASFKLNFDNKNKEFGKNLFYIN